MSNIAVRAIAGIAVTPTMIAALAIPAAYADTGNIDNTPSPITVTRLADPARPVDTIDSEPSAPTTRATTAPDPISRDKVIAVDNAPDAIATVAPDAQARAKQRPGRGSARTASAIPAPASAAPQVSGAAASSPIAVRTMAAMSHAVSQEGSSSTLLACIGLAMVSAGTLVAVNVHRYLAGQ